MSRGLERKSKQTNKIPKFKLLDPRKKTSNLIAITVMTFQNGLAETFRSFPPTLKYVCWEAMNN